MTGAARPSVLPMPALFDRQLRWLLLLAFVVLGLGIGFKLPGNVDEERFLGVALEMLQNGSWLIPHRAGEIYGDKPPLFFWAIAGLVALTGSPKLALYLPGVLSGLVGTVLIYDLASRMYDKRRALVAGMVFLLTYQTHAVLRNGQIDALLSLWISAALYGFARHLLVAPSWGWFYAACAACGLGIISKGVGFLPALIFIPYAYARRVGASGVVPHAHAAAKWWLGLLATLAAIAVWLGPVLWTAGLQGDAQTRAYLENILFRQTGVRLVNAWHHKEPFWYFFVDVIPKYWLPAILVLPWLIMEWMKQWRQKNGRTIVLLGWLVLVLLFFSLSTGKRKLYIYPAVGAWALLVAAVWPTLAERWQHLWIMRARRHLLAAWIVVLIAASVVETVKQRESDNRRLMAQVAEAIGAEKELGLAGWREGIWLYARNPIRHFGMANPEADANLLDWLRQDPGRYGLIDAAALKACFHAEQAIPVAGRKNETWFLVDQAMSNGACRAKPAVGVYAFEWRRPWL